MSHTPVIIIGAPRSGTNMLRDVLTRLPGFATWPCDEINFVWKHGNLADPGDDLQPAQVRPRTRRYVASQFQQIAKTFGAEFVVEKTCANSLRVPFVAEIVPDAKYLFLLRGGVDAVASTIKRWQSPVPGGAYYWQKFKFVAPVDRPRVLWEAMIRRLRGMLKTSDKSWSTWGPVFGDVLTAAEAGRPLAEICALQWSRCVEAAADGLSALPPETWLAVRYEAFVREPEQELTRILDFLGVHTTTVELAEAVAGVSAGSVGKGRSQLSGPDLRAIAPIIARAEAVVQQAGKAAAS